MEIESSSSFHITLSELVYEEMDQEFQLIQSFFQWKLYTMTFNHFHF